MTGQYLPTNVNVPRGSRLITEDAFLTLDDDLVVVGTSGSSIALVLPDATQIPAREINFKADTLTDPVIIGTVGGQTIDGAATTSLTSTQESLYLKSDGENWREIYREGGATCCSPVLLSLPDDFPEEFIVAAFGSAFLTFQATKVDADATATLINDPTSPNPPLIVADVDISGGGAGEPQIVTIQISSVTPFGFGSVWVVLTNACGCCQLVGRVNLFIF